jgi:hypothetical protein
VAYNLAARSSSGQAVIDGGPTHYARHKQHDGIGQRLLDGRQVAVLVHASAGEQEEARRILREISASEPWEHVVILCLRALTRSCRFRDGPGL